MHKPLTVGAAARHWIDWINNIAQARLSGALPVSLANSAPYRIFAPFQADTKQVLGFLSHSGEKEALLNRNFQAAIFGHRTALPKGTIFGSKPWPCLTADLPFQGTQGESGWITDRNLVLSGLATAGLGNDVTPYDQSDFDLDCFLLMSSLIHFGEAITALGLFGMVPMADRELLPLHPPVEFTRYLRDLKSRVETSASAKSEKTIFWSLFAEGFYRLSLQYPNHFNRDLFKLELDPVVLGFRQFPRPVPPDFVAVATALRCLLSFSTTGLPADQIHFLYELGELLIASEPLIAAKVLSPVAQITSRYKRNAEGLRRTALESLVLMTDPVLARAPVQVSAPIANRPVDIESGLWEALLRNQTLFEFAQTVSKILLSPEWFSKPSYYLQIRKGNQWTNFERKGLMYGTGIHHEIHEDLRVGFPSETPTAIVNAFVVATRSCAVTVFGPPAGPSSFESGSRTLFYGQSVPGLSGLHETIRNIDEYPREASILLCGEPGVGKTQFANFIHSRTMDAGAPFHTFTFATGLSPEMTAGELFGSVRGAFTDSRDRAGYFESASGPPPGTLFLDEIGEAPATIQPQILRALSERVTTRIGSNKTIPLTCRLIAATNRNVTRMTSDGTFRFDLFTRFDLIVDLPALRDTPEQILPVAKQYLGNSIQLSEDAKRLLVTLPWYTNYRGLEKLMRNSASVARNRNLSMIDAAFLQGLLQRMPELYLIQGGAETSAPVYVPVASGSYNAAENPFTEALEAPLVQNGNHPDVQRTEVADQLSIISQPVALSSSQPSVSSKKPIAKDRPLPSEDEVARRQHFRDVTKRIVDSLKLRSRREVLTKSQRVGINLFLRVDTLWGIDQQETIVLALKKALPRLHLHDDTLTAELIKEFDLLYTQVRDAQYM